MSRRDRISLSVQVHAETDSAVKVSLDGSRRAAVWLPKQLVTIEDETSDGFATLWITETLATTKGLV